MKPTIGRIVHYRSYGSADGTYEPECISAIVTKVDGEVVNLLNERMWKVGLAVFNPEGLYFKTACTQDESQERGGSWHWPERETEDEEGDDGGEDCSA